MSQANCSRDDCGFFDDFGEASKRGWRVTAVDTKHFAGLTTSASRISDRHRHDRHRHRHHIITGSLVLRRPSTRICRRHLCCWPLHSRPAEFTCQVAFRVAISPESGKRRHFYSRRAPAKRLHSHYISHSHDRFVSWILQVSQRKGQR